MAVGDGVRGLDSDLTMSKIPRPAPSLTPRARTPPRTQPSATPSRIPQSSAAARRRRQHSLEAPSANSRSDAPQRSLTPPPSSNLHDGDIIARLKMRCAERLRQNQLQDPHARASEIPMLRQRVEPGRTMTAPPMHSKGAASPPSLSSRRNSMPTPRSTAATAEAANSGPASADCAQGLRRTRSAGIIPIRSSTPRSAPVASKPSDFRGSSTQTRIRKSGGCPVASAVPRRQTPPPSSRFSPPVRCNSLGRASSKVGPSAAPSRATVKAASAQEETVTAPVVEQILQENRQLRDAFNRATERIAALEDGQNRFFHEGIFDLVNAAHSERPMQTFLPAADVE